MGGPFFVGAPATAAARGPAAQVTARARRGCSHRRGGRRVRLRRDPRHVAAHDAVGHWDSAPADSARRYHAASERYVLAGSTTVSAFDYHDDAGGHEHDDLDDRGRRHPDPRAAVDHARRRSARYGRRRSRRQPLQLERPRPSALRRAAHTHPVRDTELLHRRGATAAGLAGAGAGDDHDRFRNLERPDVHVPLTPREVGVGLARLSAALEGVSETEYATRRELAGGLRRVAHSVSVRCC